jgi:hypothetical protein
MENPKIKLLYIAGSGRSGTTVLARLFGEMDGFVNVGEAARYLFDAPMQRKHVPCGCGQPVSQCEFWKDKVKAIPSELVDQGGALVRMRKFLSLLTASRGTKAPKRYQLILDAITAVYRKVARETRCKVIVDSSKNPANALLVGLAPGIELHVLHVVRNPHNVVASWTKKKGYLATHPARKVIAWWWSYNVLSELLKLKAHSYQLLRYEDFVRDPSGCLQRAAAAVVDVAPSTNFLQGGEASVGMQHVLAGNPDKLDSGKIRISDGNSRVAGPRGWLVNFTTFPLQLRYRYWPSTVAPILRPTSTTSPL